MALIIKAYLATSFFQGIVTAVLSALISGVFLLISTHMIAKKTENKIDSVTGDLLKGQEDVKQAFEEHS